MKGVLLVDDEKEVAEALKTLFDLHGIPCWIAADGDQALKVAAEQKPEFILLDITLEHSRISGFEVLQEIKKLLPSTKVYMVTGYSDETSREKAMKLGADGYLEKPLTSDRILEVLRKVAG